MSKDPVTGLEIVNGKIDLSNGIPLSDEERAGLHKAADDMKAALSRLDRNEAIGSALNVLETALSLAPIPSLATRILLAAIHEVKIELGLLS